MLHLGSYGKQRGRRKDGRTQRRVNGAPNQILGGRTPQVNDQNLIVQSENYCYSSLRVASMDENKTQPTKDTNTHTQICTNRTGLRVGKKEECPAGVGTSALLFEKSPTEFKQKQNVLKC